MVPAKRDVVSIIIPARNEEKAIARGVSHALLQKFPEGVGKEILVVANGCTDRTPQIVREISAAHPQVRLVELKKASKPDAWNAGVRKAKGSTLVFMDADVMPRAGAINALKKAVAQGARVAVGRRLHVAEDGTGRVMRKLEHIDKKLGLPQGLWGMLYALKREDALKLSPMPSHVTMEDYWLDQKIGGNYAIVPSAKFEYPISPTLRRFFEDVSRRHAGVLNLGITAYGSDMGAREFKGNARKLSPSELAAAGVLHATRWAGRKKGTRIFNKGKKVVWRPR
ncbi:MAG: glycosyltransferase [Candidatus Micrarchaeia archaeon]|jgi:glycosyltransferase involved in cell wall biosynthesis